jgi:hypothetical protein
VLVLVLDLPIGNLLPDCIFPEERKGAKDAKIAKEISDHSRASCRSRARRSRPDRLRAGSSDQGSFAAFALLRVFAFFRSGLTSRISALDIDRLSERRRAEPAAAAAPRRGFEGMDVDVDDRRRPLLQLVRELGVLGLLAI